MNLHPVASLDETRGACAHSHFRVRHLAKPRDRHVGELVLLGLYHERVCRFAPQPVEIELSDQLERWPVPELERARDQPDAQVLVDQAELGEDLERRRLGGGGARAVVDAVLRFEQCNQQSKARTRQRRHRADRARADDDDVSPLHFSRRLY
jgi:hypothetical protein